MLKQGLVSRVRPQAVPQLKLWRHANRVTVQDRDSYRHLAHRCSAKSEESSSVSESSKTIDETAAPTPSTSSAPAKPLTSTKQPLKLQTATLLVKCPDSKGVIASLAQLLFGFGCNVVSSDQFSDVNVDMFFQRVVFDYTDLVIGTGNTPVLERAIDQLAQRYKMDWKISYRDEYPRVAVLVSKADHCLYDILIRTRNGELRCEIPVIISNHPDLKYVADMFGVPFVHLAMPTGKGPEAKLEQEALLEEVLKANAIDVIVLARYMQIFSTGFCERHWPHTINIHHSFLPAFEGARPYHRAHDRGVKIIGATAHFATAELDSGPIIEQGITRITHKDTVEDMMRKGRDLERVVLARALRWFLHDRVLVHGNKTIVFED